MGADSFNALAWLSAVLSPACTLDPSESMVMLALVRHAGADGLAWPGFGKLGAETRLGRTKVIRALAELKRRGLLTSSQPLPTDAGISHNELQQYFDIPPERRPNLYALPLAPPLAALAAENEGCARSTSAPRELVHDTHGSSAPGELGGVRQEDGRGAPGAPKLLRELPIGTTQGTGEARNASTAPVSTKVEQLERKQKEPRGWRRVPATWEPNDAHRRIAAAEGAAFTTELERFRDHEFKDRKTDADACFSNWLRRSKTFGGARGKPVVQRGGTVRQGDLSFLDGIADEPPDRARAAV